MSVFHLLFLNIYLVVFGVHANKVGDNCQLESTKSPGQCTLLKECPAALNEIRESRIPQVCGFQGNEAIVCCVRTPSTPAEFPSQQEETERISRKKCKEYRQAISEVVDIPSFFLYVKPIRKEVCSKVVSGLEIGGDAASPKQFPHMVAQQRIVCTSCPRNPLSPSRLSYIPRHEITLYRTERKIIAKATYGQGRTVWRILKDFADKALLGYGLQNDINWLCGGSLISEQFVLTAAHCIVTPQYGEVSWIRLGDLNISSTTDDAQPQDFRVAERIAHPEYKRPLIYNDIALLKMNRAVTFTDFIAPACLYTGAPALRPEQRFYATNWGSWEPFLNSPMHLKKILLDQITHRECNASYKEYITRKIKFGIIPETQLCAGRKSKDICQEGSGGPLQIFSELTCMYDIVGVTSFGIRCDPSVPVLYTRVSHYLDWIEKIVWP